MQTYDPSPALRPTGSPLIPGMRPAYESEDSASGTPIYDALYAEYRRLFRALPGDRSGEEHMRFVGFGLRRPYGGRPAEQPAPGARGPAGPEHTHGGHGYAAPHFAQGHPYGGQGAGSAGGQSSGGWTPVGHIPPSQAHGQPPGGRHRHLLSLPPGRGGAARP